MNHYRFPEGFAPLAAWLRAQGADVRSFATERQAAFMAQQLAGTRFKFPPKGASCFLLLQSIQRSLPVLSVAAAIEPRRPRSGGRKPLASIKKPRHVRSLAHDLAMADLDRSVPPGLVIYADGCCEPNPGAGGWGFVVYRDGAEIHAESGGESVTTNNAMEMSAALKALLWFADRGVVEPIRMLCDSMYVVNGCNDWRHGWKRKGWRRGPNSILANADLWQELDSALTAVPITLEWVRGHTGVIGNERADELATIGMNEALATQVAPDLIAQQLAYSI